MGVGVGVRGGGGGGVVVVVVVVIIIVLTGKAFGIHSRIGPSLLSNVFRKWAGIRPELIKK